MNQAKTAYGPLPRQNRTGILERGPCRHPLAALTATAIDLDRVELVESASGYGHRLYSDRGPVESPCHWPVAKVAQVVCVKDGFAAWCRRLSSWRSRSTRCGRMWRTCVGS